MDNLITGVRVGGGLLLHKMDSNLEELVPELVLDYRAGALTCDDSPRH